MTNIWPRRAWAAVAVIAIASAATASVQTLVGVNHVTFAWQPATGSLSGYFVWRSLNGGALRLYSFAVVPQIDIPMAPGDQVAIQVAATGYDSAGVLGYGPRSLLSDPVVVLPAPKLHVAGSWLMRCTTCPSLERRALADASVVEAQSPALLLPWVVLGHAELESGADAIVWYNPQTGELAVWDSSTLAPIPGRVAGGATTLRGIGGADLRGDGVEEFLFQEFDTLLVSARRLTAHGFQRIAQTYGPPGQDLVAARDFDLDGRVDLIWQDRDAGTLELTRLAANSAAPLTWLAPTRVASGLPVDARVVSTGDYDGDQSPDLLVRFRDGRLAILYLNKGALKSTAWLPSAPDDVNRFPIDSVDVDGIPGDEIALRHRVTGEISILYPSVTTRAARLVVLDPGPMWTAIGID